MERDSSLPLEKGLFAEKNWFVHIVTKGKDPFSGTIVKIHIWNRLYQYDFNAASLTDFELAHLSEFLEDREIRKTCINSKMVYKFFKLKLGIEMENSRCMMTAEKVISGGEQEKTIGGDSYELQYHDIMLKRKIPTTADPFQMIEDAYEKQIQIMKRDKLGDTFMTECLAIPAFADMEINGLPIDKDVWKKVMEDNIAKRAEVEKEIQKHVEYHYGEGKTINIGSPKQVLELLQYMRIKIPREKDDGDIEYVPISGTSDKELRRIANSPIVSAIKKWRSLSVLINTFGQPYLDAINPKTGAIHPDYNVYGTETGRPSSGLSPVNLLNIPKEGGFREAVKCGPGEVVETDDWSGCEARILGQVSGDGFLKWVFANDKDIHCEVGSMIFEVPVEKTGEGARFRSPAKALNFGIVYGKTKFSFLEDMLSMGFNITKEKAYSIFDKFTNIMAQSLHFLDYESRKALHFGFAANINGRRRYFGEVKKNSKDYPHKQREARNFFIQSVNADFAKDALAEIRDCIKINDFRTRIVHFVYDEIVTVTHKDDHEEFHKMKVAIMKRCAEMCTPKIKSVVDSHIGPSWTK